MRCNFPIDNSTCRIVNNILHLSSRTIRKIPFSNGIYSTVLDNPQGEKHKLKFDWIEICRRFAGADHDGMTKSQLKKWILKFRQYYEAKREKGPNKTS